MNFNKHSNLSGHAAFGASKSSWLRYEPEKMIETVVGQMRTALGTELHDYAACEIKLRHKKKSVKEIKDGFEAYVFNKYRYEDSLDITAYGIKLINGMKHLPKEVFETIKSYINDGTGYLMEPEVKLVYSDLFWGTTDTISFRNNYLRIHDLKTGSTTVHIEQLEIYAALFCLEYKMRPNDIDIELRIYQNDEILFHKPQADEIAPIMDKIISDNKYLSKLVEEDEKSWVQ